jgi:hypothetical protein
MSKGGRPKAQVKMSDRLNTSVTPHEAAEFKKACFKVRMEPAYVLRQLATAFTDHVKANESLLLPIRISTSKADKPL